LAYLRAAPLLILSLIIIAAMIRSGARDMGPTGLPGDLRNWHNRPGDLSFFTMLVCMETAIAFLILRPWSYRRSWARAATATLLFAPWSLLNLLVIIHGGGIMVVHTLWLLGLVGIFASLTFVSAFAAFHHRITAPL
jgi:hypothetical protein